MKIINRIGSTCSFLLNFLTTADRILLLLLIFVAGGSTLIVSQLQKQGERVLIFQNNELKYQFKLNENRMLALHPEDNYMQIRMMDKKVWVTESTCPAKICIKMGKISKTGQSIVCVPNKVFIQITGKSRSKFIDVITE